MIGTLGNAFGKMVQRLRDVTKNDKCWMALGNAKRASDSISTGKKSWTMKIVLDLPIFKPFGSKSDNLFWNNANVSRDQGWHGMQMLAGR